MAVVNEETVAAEIEWLLDGKSTHYGGPEYDFWVGPNDKAEFELYVETSGGTHVKTFVVSVREGSL